MTEKLASHEQGSLAGKVAIVTGGSGGIGRATAVELARAGARVAVHFNRSQARADEVVSLCRSVGAQAISVQADLTREDDVTRLFIAATELGLPQILVNNAGQAHYGLLMDMPLAAWQAVINVNLTSVFLCMKAALPYFRRAGSGRIINVSSIHGITGASNEAAYAASKGGLIALTKSAAREFGSQRITVNAVAPGIIDTPMMEGFSAEDIATMVEDTPVQRLGTPEDVANVIRFLATDDASFLTGQVISPNGGLVT